MNYFLSLLSLVVAGTLTAQSSGFYGKKMVVDVSGLGRIPMWNNMNATNKTSFSPGLTLGFAGAVSKTISIGAEMCMQYNSFDSEKYLSSVGDENTYVYTTYRDQIRYRATSALFKVEFHVQNMAPYGISHVIAIGPTFCHGVDKSYQSYQTYDYYGEGATKQDFGAKDTELTLMYAFNGRTAITESLWLNFGVRTTLNIPFTGTGNSPLELLFDHSQGDVKSAIQQSQLRNIFSARIGLSYAF